MRGDRDGLARLLEDAMVAGRDPAKIHLAIAQADKDLMELEAAQKGFTEKQEGLRKLEAVNAKASLLDKHRQQSDKLEAVTKKWAAMMEEVRVVGAEMAGLAKQQDRTTTELEGLGERRLRKAPGIIRDAIGEVRRGDGVSEYGRRIDIGIELVLSDNPSIMRRAQIMRRGRVGETNRARDMATEGWMKLARAQ
jgi:hypothetical protein